MNTTKLAHELELYVRTLVRKEVEYAMDEYTSPNPTTKPVETKMESNPKKPAKRVRASSMKPAPKRNGHRKIPGTKAHYISTEGHVDKWTGKNYRAIKRMAQNPLSVMIPYTRKKNLKGSKKYTTCKVFDLMVATFGIKIPDNIAEPTKHWKDGNKNNMALDNLTYVESKRIANRGYEVKTEVIPKKIPALRAVK